MMHIVEEPFDMGRAVLHDHLDSEKYPPRLDVTDPLLIGSALEAGKLTPETPLLTFEDDGALYALPMSVVLSYNVIQGQINPHRPWMMAFCNACNAGMVFNPTVDGRLLHFSRRGSYNGLMLIWDEETNTYWQHLTGRALYGSSEGKQMEQLTVTRQMTAAEAAVHPRAMLFNPPLTPGQTKLSVKMEQMRAVPQTYEAGIVSTIAREDTRRPRFELGLGVWTEKKCMFFPLTLLHQANNRLIAAFDGKPLLIYQTPEALAPVAVFLDTDSARWENDILRLSDGRTIHNDLLVSTDGRVQPLDAPDQLLMRWYGFALTFPGCELPPMIESLPERAM